MKYREPESVDRNKILNVIDNLWFQRNYLKCLADFSTG